jgi:hypothetical protein
VKVHLGKRSIHVDSILTSLVFGLVFFCGILASYI